MGMAERHLLEFRYTYPGRLYVSSHQDQIADRGCMGWFDVLPALVLLPDQTNNAPYHILFY